ncbi:MAG: hypothetical protein KAX05_13565 [Bacteroidales bacterium]|nr:hypothetical protein [Bacteroidales bacterium]
MNELCVPIPHFGEEQSAEILLKVGEKQMSYNFRVVSFPWDVKDEFSNDDDEITRSLARITRLKSSIKNYNRDWELIQIFTPLEDAKNIQVLYRKREKLPKD